MGNNPDKYACSLVMKNLVLQMRKTRHKGVICSAQVTKGLEPIIWLHPPSRPNTSHKLRQRFYATMPGWDNWLGKDEDIIRECPGHSWLFSSATYTSLCTWHCNLNWGKQSRKFRTLKVHSVLLCGICSSQSEPLLSDSQTSLWVALWNKYQELPALTSFGPFSLSFKELIFLFLFLLSKK